MFWPKSPFTPPSLTPGIFGCLLVYIAVFRCIIISSTLIVLNSYTSNGVWSTLIVLFLLFWLLIPISKVFSLGFNSSGQTFHRAECILVSLRNKICWSHSRAKHKQLWKAQERKSSTNVLLAAQQQTTRLVARAKAAWCQIRRLLMKRVTTQSVRVPILGWSWLARLRPLQEGIAVTLTHLASVFFLASFSFFLTLCVLLWKALPGTRRRNDEAQT